MADLVAISQFATAAGTLVLAGATFAAVRSANTAARTAERSLMTGLRPLLIPSRVVDPPMKVLWSDSHFIALEGGRAYAHIADDVIYLAMAVRRHASWIGDVLEGLVRGLPPDVLAALDHQETRSTSSSRAG